MKSSLELAKFTALQALTQPFRQVPCMTTEQFRQWLDARSISFSNWSSLHFLWSTGVLRPIIVLEPALTRTPGLKKEGRFSKIELGLDSKCYLDLGMTVEAVPVLDDLPKEEKRQLRDSLLWHPFQLYQLFRLHRTLKSNPAVDMVLRGAEEYGAFAARLLEGSSQSLVALAEGQQNESFTRILCLLLSAEPLVHPAIFSQISLGSGPNSSLESYFKWRETIDAVGILAQTRLSIDEVKSWHRELSVQAQIADPVDDLWHLLQHVDRRHLQRVEEAALLGLELRDHAQMLRRYLEHYLDIELYEEDDYRSGPGSQSFKNREFGTHRTLDSSRASLRRIARYYGVDPSVRIIWYVEGDTEYSFITRYADNNHIDLPTIGIELANLRGKDGLDTNKLLRHLLNRHKSELAFAFISLDEDGGGDHIRILRKLAHEGLLTSGFRVWRPDFEGENFSNQELAAAASTLAVGVGVPFTISKDEVERVMREKSLPSGRSIERLLRQYKVYSGKGRDWGVQLADLAAASPMNRPFDEVFRLVSNAMWADYEGSIEHLAVDDAGNLIEREVNASRTDSPESN